MRSVIYVSGTRADFGLMEQTLKKINDHKELSLKIISTGMHLMREFGSSHRDIEAKGFDFHKIDSVFENDSKYAVTQFISNFVDKFSNYLGKNKTDIILVLGDRPEMLAASIVGTYLSIPVAHIHGGEKTLTLDEFARHTITKLSHIHFPATKESAQRIIKMGEDKWRVFLVGAPGLDQIKTTKFEPKDKIFSGLGFSSSKPMVIVLQHPVSAEIEKAPDQMNQTLEAVKELRLPSLIIYPNADPGGRSMIKIIEQYRNEPLFKIKKNINHKEFLQYFFTSDAIVGNSSAGLIEAPSLRTPTVNIGTRQNGREKSSSVIDVGYNKMLIKKAISRAISNDFKSKLSGFNIYGEGNTGNKIAKKLAEIKLNRQLLEKQLTY